MSLIVGFVGRDGVVMASDTEATERDHTRFDSSKIWECEGLLLGYSGNTAVEVPVAKALHEDLGKLKRNRRDRERQVKCMQDAVQPVIDRIYSKYVPRPPEGTIPAEIAGHLLASGHDAEGYWLGHLDASNMFTFVTRGFYAIGSGSVGAQIANGLMSRYEVAGRVLDDVRLVAHRTVSACIAVLGSGYGVGGEIKMWESHNASPYRELTKNEIDHVGYGVETWIGLEKESLSLMNRTAKEWETDTGILVVKELPPDLA